MRPVFLCIAERDIRRHEVFAEYYYGSYQEYQGGNENNYSFILHLIPFPVL
jgi:hypothetical protein